MRFFMRREPKEPKLPDHDWCLVASWYSGESKDTITMCSKCGTVKHDYEPKSVNYPRYFSAVGGSLPTLGGGLGDSQDEPECVAWVDIWRELGAIGRAAVDKVRAR